MTIGLIHSTRLVMPRIEAALEPYAQRSRFLHALDEALIVELAKGEGVTDGALRRIAFLAESLMEAGASRLILTCSSLSPAVDLLAPRLSSPIVKVDEAMVESAIASRRPFTILGTNPSTKLPLRKIVETVAAKIGILPDWEYELLDGAFAALDGGDIASHDRQVAEAIGRIAGSGRRILLAQISMARILPSIGALLRNDVLTSLDYIETTLFGPPAKR